MVITDSLFERLRPWIEDRISVPLSALRPHPVPVLAAERPAELEWPLLAVRFQRGTGVVVKEPGWIERLRPVVSELHPDMIFSSFGSYELSRVTLPDGVSMWGPSWYLFGDESTVIEVKDERVNQVSQADLKMVDYSMFWHHIPNSPTGFGVHENGDLVALATVANHGEVWEIAMEVAPSAQGKGLGRGVVSAATQWILGNGCVPLATVGPFNVPSTRTLRSVGLRYAFEVLEGRNRRFEVPPQPLGAPLPGTEIYDYYPRWAMNKNIKPRTI